MLNETEKKFIEDYMAFACKFCYDVRDFKTCSQVYTRCMEKAMYMAVKMCGKGWNREGRNSE